jgi:eukaryotic-like serine/threonine-protein kinase
MATGKRAFEGKTTASVIAAILEREPPPISTIQPMSPPALDRTVKNCLAKDPDERFQSAHDVKLQLEWVREAGSQAGAPASVSTRRKNRERIAWAAAGLLTSSTLLFAIGYFLCAPKAVSAIVSEISPPSDVRFVLTGNFSDPPAISPDGKWVVFGGPPTFGSTSSPGHPPPTLAAAAGLSHRATAGRNSRGNILFLVSRQSLDRLFRQRQAEPD